MTEGSAIGLALSSLTGLPSFFPVCLFHWSLFLKLFLPYISFNLAKRQSKHLHFSRELGTTYILKINDILKLFVIVQWDHDLFLKEIKKDDVNI